MRPDYKRHIALAAEVLCNKCSGVSSLPITSCYDRDSEDRCDLLAIGAPLCLICVLPNAFLSNIYYTQFCVFVLHIKQTCQKNPLQRVKQDVSESS